jgi:nucleotide-binding universal stress UspA family protein
MFTNILVPLDGSFVGETALPFARTLASRTGARLTLIRAARTPPFSGNHGVDQLRAISEAEAYLAARSQELAADGLTVETGVPLAGSPSTWIVEEAATRSASLIVMATHDRSGPNRWLHGSVAEFVVSRSAVPVLLVRATHGEHAIERLSGVAPALVVPLDGSSHAEAALPVARSVARGLDGSVTLVCVLPAAGQLVAEPGGGLRMYIGADHDRLTDDARVYLESRAAGLRASGLQVEPRLKLGKPAAEIHRTADELGAGMVVMATHGRTGLARAVLGSVAGEVLHHGTTPVLLVRPAELRLAEEPCATSYAVSGVMPA